ncbi:MAG: GerMN domain-containing protein [Eubacteriales bacterium]
MRKISILICSVMLIICSSCTDNPSSEPEDYRVAYEEYSEEVVELNDINRIQLDDDHIQTNIYYKDVSGYVVPVLRQLPKQDGLAKNTLIALIDNAENRLDLIDLGLSPVLPEEITFELAIKEDHTIRVDFNDAILSFSSEKEEQIAVQSVVYTLTEFESVDQVQFLVNNEIKDTLTYGTDVSKPLTRNNINSLNNHVSGESVKRAFYSYNNITSKYTYFIPITKNIPKDQNDIASLVTEAININKDLNITIPEGFNVKNTVLEDDIAYLTVEKEVDSNDDDFIRLMKALCLTISQNEVVTSVKLIVENEEVENMQILTFTIPQHANVY